MRFKVLIVTGLLVCHNMANATEQILLTDSIKHPTSKNIIDIDSLFENLPDSVVHPVIQTKIPFSSPTPNKKVVEKKMVIEDVEKRTSKPDENYFKIPAYIEPVKIDSLILNNNPFFIDLVFMGYPDNFVFNLKPDFQTLYFGTKPSGIDNYLTQPKIQTAEQIIANLRRNAREEITKTAAHVYRMSYDDLPDPNGVKNRMIQGKPIRDIKFVDDKVPEAHKKLQVKKVVVSPWTRKANSLLQFSQNMASDNWYQGGNSTMAVLGVLNGQLNYDNKKNIQWENNAEWRMGINAVFNDSTAKRDINTNDDILKINSKLGIKAFENLFYSGSVDFSTQFFHNYKGVNSDIMKASFLSPVRLNIGMGLDYKYKKIFSLMLSPVSYKYIYLKNRSLDPNLFGIKDGEHVLSELGSSFKAQCSYSPFRELQIDSKLSFYTNYQKVEIDWEIVGNFIVNRFLSTRLSLNPRYDNTVILAAGEKAKLQFKELLSFGFSYKLLNK